jgi:hypothetical protein
MRELNELEHHFSKLDETRVGTPEARRDEVGLRRKLRFLRKWNANILRGIFNAPEEG